jgi:outer membrane lipoprotein-sorting protein
VTAFARASAIAALLLCALVPPARAQTGLDALLASFRAIEALECRFHEEKRIALLFAPIVTDGTIHYVRPGRLARRVTSPSPEVVLIEGSTLRMGRAGHEETIDLASQPVVRSFVDSIVQLLAGDRAALERSYTITEESWGSSEGGGGTRLTLRPRSSPLSDLLGSIEFELRGTTLVRMVMTETSGDVTTTTFSDVDTERRYGASELARIFSLE